MFSFRELLILVDLNQGKIFLDDSKDISPASLETAQSTFKTVTDCDFSKDLYASYYNQAQDFSPVGFKVW